MTKIKTTGAAKFLLILVLLVSLTGCEETAESSLLATVGYQYTMYIGLNDQDTYSQEIPTEEAIDIVSDIVLNYVEGFTVSEGQGAYKDEDGIMTYENSLILVFMDVPEADLKAMMDEIKAALNQHAILLEKHHIAYTFYEGASE